MNNGPKPYTRTKSSGIDWLGDIPSHWSVVRGKQLFRCIDERSSTGSEQLLTVSSDRGVVPRASTSVTMFKAASYVGHKLCWPGDLVINSLWAWAGGLGVSNYHGLISSAYGVYRLRRPAAQEATYFHRLVRSSPFHFELQVRSKGIWTSRLQLTDEAFLAAPMPLPSHREQTAIALFLDHMDRRIQKYIGAKEEQIALLEEYKRLVIHDAVTGRTDVRTDKPFPAYKDSGIEWLGDLPEHWQVVRNGRLFAQRNEVGFSELPILEVSLRSGVRVRDFDNSSRKQVMSDRGMYKRAVKGDIAYNMMRMWQGAVGVAPVDGLVSPAYVVARPLTGTEPRYFDHLFHTNAYMIEVDKYSRGIVKDRNRLYWEDFKQLPTPCPPPDEQVLIADAIDRKARFTSTQVRRAQQQISLANEFCTRLIADVVTGKLDVREASAKLPDVNATLFDNGAESKRQ